MVRRLIVVTSLSVIALGCTSDRVTSPLRPDAAQLAKPVGPVDPTASFLFPIDDGTLGVKSDHLYVSGTSSVYANGVCGVDSKIFSTTQLSNSGDAVMQTDNPQWADRKCANYPRKVYIDYGDGTGPHASTIFMNVRDLERENDPTDILPVGGSKLTGLNLQESRCGALVWRPVQQDGTVTGADNVLLTRTAADTWTVTTQGNQLAYCKNTGQLLPITARFTIVTSRALAVP